MKIRNRGQPYNDDEWWARIWRAVDAVRSHPKHRVTAKAKEHPASKGRAHQRKTDC